MALDVARFFEAEWQDHVQAAEATRISAATAFAGVLGECATSIRSGGKLLFCGNGGSAADAQHLATELTIRYKTDRAPIAAIALTTDTSALTAAGNDLGFDHIFARQVLALGKPGDVLIGITTSGRSPNVLAAFATARAMGIKTVAFTGQKGEGLKALCDHALVVPSHTTARIQEMHITLGQMLCGALELELGLVSA